MPTASRSGSHRRSRLNWRSCDRSLSRPGQRPRRRPRPFAELAAGLRALNRFFEAYPDWFPPPEPEPPRPIILDPEWELAIQRAYHPGSSVPADSIQFNHT